MKKKLLLTLVMVALVLGVTGCGCTKKESEKKNEKIVVVCTSPKTSESDIENQTVTTYNFDSDQYVTDYAMATTQKFTKKSVYDTYKAAQEDTVSNADTEFVKYDLKASDEELILVFTMTIKVDATEATTEASKEALKASEIIKTKELFGDVCEVKGIDRSELK